MPPKETKEEIIPIREEVSRETQSQDTEQFVEPHQLEEGRDILYRRLLPPNTATVGRSVKLRDKFTISGAVVSDSTVVSVTAAGSSGNQTDLKSFKFFPNEWHPNMMVRVTARGIYTSDGTRTATLRIGSGLAPTTEWNSMTSTAASTTNAPWELTWIGIVTTIGSSGTLEAQMTGKINNVNKDDANTATVALATNTAIILAMTIDWDGSDADNSWSVRQFIVEVLY